MRAFRNSRLPLLLQDPLKFGHHFRSQDVFDIIRITINVCRSDIGKLDQIHLPQAVISNCLSLLGGARFGQSPTVTDGFAKAISNSSSNHFGNIFRFP